MGKVKLVGFDVNGTLFNDTKLFWAAINGIFPRFGKPELPPEVLVARFGQPWTKIYRDAGITEAMADDAELYRIYNELYSRGPTPKPFLGVKGALTWLSKRAIDLVIVSTQQNAITIPLLAQYGLVEFFLPTHILGGVNDKAVAIAQFYDHLDVTAEEVAYLGDQEGDVRHAQKAGCVSIAFAGGLHSRERLVQVRPSHIISKYAELKKLPIF